MEEGQKHETCPNINHVSESVINSFDASAALPPSKGRHGLEPN